MKKRFPVVVIFMIMSFPIKAESLDEIGKFAEKICINEVQGHITRDSIETGIKADVKGLAKLLGLSVEADGSLKHDNQTYNGIPIDKLSEKIPTPAQCKSELAKILLDERKRLQSEEKKWLTQLKK